MLKRSLVFGSACIYMLAGCLRAHADVGMRQVEQYNYSIHILAMLLVGFGFLMVFVKKHGNSATTGTYLVVGAGIPLYLFLRSIPSVPEFPDASRERHPIMCGHQLD